LRQPPGRWPLRRYAAILLQAASFDTLFIFAFQFSFRDADISEFITLSFRFMPRHIDATSLIR